MKKVIVMMMAAGFLAAGCSSINTATVNGQEIVTSTEAAPVIFTAWGAPTEKCLTALNAEGVKTVVDADGGPGLWISRISNWETCQVSGTK
jgi:hypothetical protein